MDNQALKNRCYTMALRFNTYTINQRETALRYFDLASQKLYPGAKWEMDRILFRVSLKLTVFNKM